MNHLYSNVTIEYATASIEEADRWVPACGGHETPTLARDGRRYLYVFNFATRKHGWLDTGTDIVRESSPYEV